MPAESSLTYPTSKHLNARDGRVLLLWLLAGLIGAGVAYRYFFQAFPEASVNFTVTRGAALDQAREFAISRGASLAGYQSSIVFNVDDDAKTYLEREVGLEQANQLMSSEVNVWYWDVRFFRPLQKEEFRVHVDPAGRIVGFEHVLAEAAPGARLERADALSRARAFLRDTLRTPLEDYTLLPEETSSTARPNRTDWSFTWERTGFRAKDAPYRLEVTLAGDGTAGYREFLKVPEAWLRDYARLRSSNDFIEELALIPYALLLGAAISIILALGRRGAAPWNAGLKLGLFITLLYFVMQLDQWPLTRASYDTNGSYSSFFLGQMGTAIITSIFLAVLVVIAVIPGEPLYRLGQPDRLRLGAAFSLPGIRTKQFFMSGVIGLCLAGAHIGYVVVFYVLGRRAGVWAPQDLQYSDTLSTALPWIYPLTIGIYAAASEELLFRLFSIRFLLRTTNSRVLAVVLPAFAWGFLHSNYPQEPAYTRGIEVGLIGIVAGLVMLRWGIVATLTWHYTVDAFLVGLSLMRSPGAYNRVSGGIVGLGGLIVVGVAGLLYLARGGFVDETPLLNSALPLVEAPPAVTEEIAQAPSLSAYAPIRPNRLALLIGCGILGAALLAIKTQSFGDFVTFSVDAKQAEQRADAALEDSKVDPGGYMRAAVIQYTFDPLAAEYLRRGVGLDGVNRIYRDQIPSAFWIVRYFRDSQNEEYRVVLKSDGALHSIHRIMAEAAPGPKLSDDQAVERASAYLRDHKGLDLSKWKLVGNESKALPARTDHTLTWEQIAPLAPPIANDEGAHARVEVQVQGDEVSGYRIFVHIPEEWERQQNQRTLLNTLQSIGFVAIVSALGVAILVVFLRNLKHPAMASVPWRRMAGWCLPVLLASLATFITSLPRFLINYPTQIPFKIYLGTLSIGLLLGSALFYAAAAFLFGLAWFFVTHERSARQMPGWRGMPRAYYRDALVVGISGFGALAGLHRLHDIAARFWPVLRHSLDAAAPGVLDATQPAINGMAVATTRSFFTLGALALILGFAAWYLRRTWQQAVLLIALAVFLVPEWGSAGDFLQAAIINFITLAVIWWGAQRIVRLNLLGYFLVAGLLLLAGPAVELLGQPNSHFHANGWVLVAAATLLLLWPVFAWRRSGASNMEDA